MNPPGSGLLEFGEFCQLAAKFLVEEDEEALKKELKEAFRWGPRDFLSDISKKKSIVWKSMYFSQISDFCDENVCRIYDKDCMGFISTGISAHSVECLDQKHSTNKGK